MLVLSASRLFSFATFCREQTSSEWGRASSTDIPYRPLPFASSPNSARDCPVPRERQTETAQSTFPLTEFSGLNSMKVSRYWEDLSCVSLPGRNTLIGPWLSWLSNTPPGSLWDTRDCPPTQHPTQVPTPGDDGP